MAIPKLLACILFLLSIPRPSSSQRSPAAAQPANITTCNGIFLNYQFQSRQKIHPFVSNPGDQPYSFGANVTLLNSGTTDLKAWTLAIGFSHSEIIVSVSNAVVSDGSTLPFASDPKTPVVFSGFPNPDLRNPIATAGDLSQIQTTVSITGTQFGVAPPGIPLASTISLSDPAWTCPPAAIAKSNTSIFTCCVPNLDPLTNSTLVNNSTLDYDQSFLPLRAGDLSITYDIIQAYPSSYLALVTIENESPLGRLDNWRLSWEWMRGEFIYSIKGAYTSLLSASDCIYGKQGQFYQDLDFSKVVNCQQKPTILDLPLSMANDSNAGKITNCCRNGTILPKIMDPLQSTSAFQLQVFKMPPDLNRTVIIPPQNWRIKGALLNPDYTCADLLGIVEGLDFHNRSATALAVFEIARRAHGDSLFSSSAVVPVVIGIMGRHGQLSAAASLLDGFSSQRCPADVYAYTSLITAYARNERFRDAISVFRKMEEEEIKPTLVTYNIILNIYGKLFMPWQKILSLVEVMKRDGISPDRYTYNTLISCCRRGSLHEEAIELFKEMKSVGLAPDKVTYNALLDVYGKSRKHEEAMVVLGEMDANGFPPSIVTYNSLISAYTKDGILEEAMELKGQMEAKGIESDVITYTTLISGFEKAGKDELAMRTFEEMERKGCRPNLCTYNALIKMHGNRGKFADMMIIFEKLKTNGFTPDIVTWNSLLAIFGQNGMYIEVSGIFKEMRKAGFVPERETYNTLISAYSRCGLFNQAMEIYENMLKVGIGPDLSTYNAVMAALARGKLWQQAERIVTEMKKFNCKPNELTYCSLLHAYANAKELDRMKSVEDHIYAKVIEPRNILFKTLVLVNSKNNLLPETERAFMELKNRRCSLDITTLNAMVSIYGRRQMVSKVNELLKFMRESGFTPTLTTYNSLINMYSRMGDFERADAILRKIKERGERPDLYTYNTVICAYGKHGQMKDAARIFSELQASGIEPDVVTYNIFVSSYVGNSMFVEAIDVIIYMIKHECRPNDNTYNSIVDGFCKQGRRDEANSFVQNLQQLNPKISKEQVYRLSERLARSHC